MKYNNKVLTKFIAFAYGIAWPLQIIGSVFAIRGIQIAFTGVLAISMFAPLVAAWISGVGISNISWKPKFKNRIRYIFIGLYLPVIGCILGAAIYFLVRPGALDLSGGIITQSIPAEAVAQMEAIGMNASMLLLISFIQSITYAPFINMFFACGEEAGWRGVMVPMLKDKYGLVKGNIISGIVWGLWHVPVILIAGYEYGAPVYTKPIISILGVLVFCVFTTSIGVILDWLYIKSEHIWVPALFHGAINACAGVFTYFVSVEHANETILGPMPVGIIGVIPFAIFATILLVKGY